MTIQVRQVTVSTSATALTGIDTDYKPGSSIIVQAPAGNTLWVGGADVNTTTTGWAIPAGTTLAVDISGSDVLYGVIAAGTDTATVLRVGV
jgi:hypothetical protein